jgi:ribonucleotide reductase alpha subunit
MPDDEGVSWGPIGRTVYERTYQRVKANGEKETWADTVRRVIEGNTGLVDAKYIEPGEKDKLFDLIYNFKMIPAGRHLWVSGVPGRQFLFNCHRAAFTDKLSTHYTFAFDELMKGGGVGANYSNRYIDTQQEIINTINVHVTCDPAHPDYESMLSEGVISTEFSHLWDGAVRIEDSREGWVDALEDIFENATLAHGNDGHAVLVYDVSNVREKGAPIRGFGGTASGPIALALMLRKIEAILNNAQGRRLTSLEHMQLDHRIAECVVAGNVRRSARMSIKSWMDNDIFDFISCKFGFIDHWSTNISVEIDDEFFLALKGKKHKMHSHAVAVYQRVVEGMFENGEPGFYNISLASDGELGDVGSTNPCGEIALEPWENCFRKDTKIVTKEYGVKTLESLLGKAVSVPVNGSWHEAEVHYFGEQPVNEIKFIPVSNRANKKFQRTRSKFLKSEFATINHRWELIDGSITDALSVGDIIPMSASVIDETSQDYIDGVRHGIIFGDGCTDRQYADGDYRHRVRFFGDKAEEMSRYFDHITYPNSNGCFGEGWFRCSENLKEFPNSDRGPDYIGGFIYGWCLADAQDKNGSTKKLGSQNVGAEEWLVDNAALGGWILRSISSTNSETNFGKRKNPLKFFTLSREDSELAWMVDSITRVSDSEPVYCAVVPGVESFTLSSGIKTKNCNLGHVNVSAFYDDFESSKEAFRLMTRFLMRATFGDVPNPLQREVVDRNRRIGVGFFGYQGWLVKQGIRYSDSHRNRYVRKTLKDWKAVVDKEKIRYSHQLRIPIPIKGTTLAPTGTIAKLAGESEGLQTIYSPFFKRRVRYADTDTALEQLIADGVEVEDDIYTVNTKVATFYVKDPLVAQVEALGMDAEIVEGAQDVSLSDFLAIQSMVQECYADNAISFTVNIEPDERQREYLAKQIADGVEAWALQVGPPSYDTVERAKATIIHYLPNLKGTTIMIDGSRPQSPYERISRAEYELAEYVKSTGSGELACGPNGCPDK